MLFTALIEVLRDIIREGRGWTITLGLAAGLLAALMMAATTADSANKHYAVGVLFCLGGFLGANVGLYLDKRRKPADQKD